MPDAQEKDMEDMTPREKVDYICNAINARSADKRFYSPLFSGHLTLVDASSPGRNQAKTTWDFTNDDYWQNQSGNLHGGAQSTIFDICTSMTFPIIARPGFWFYGGVSRTLNVTYLRPAPVGEVLRLECEILHAGQRLAVAKGVMTRKSDGAIVSICEHNKVNTDPMPEPKL